jgi:V8-like Glu-specific endopeptidase
MKMTAILLLVLSLSAVAGTKVIYGDDNRVEVKDSTNSLFVELAKSTAAMINKSNLSGLGSTITISGATLESRGMCNDERFSAQITAASCSGFLVGPDLIVTAGHCIKSINDCNKYRWVFDYAYTEASKGSFNVPKSSVYKCTKIIERKLTNSDRNDYALVKLERVVSDRSPLKFRTSGQIAKGEDLVVIGHPTGLPTKIADGANVRSLKRTYFTANLDTYGGNSGSAVFNVNTGEVEGILVRGATDYVRAPSRSCRISNRISNNGGRGEDVTYITNIQALQNL